MRGQQSIEYLIIVGLTVGLVVGATMLYIGLTKDQDAQAISTQIGFIGNEVVEKAKQTYLLGYGARETLEVNLPGSIRRIYVDPVANREFIIEYETSYGISEAVFFSSSVLVPPNLDGNVTKAIKGIIKLQFDSQGSNVTIKVAGET